MCAGLLAEKVEGDQMIVDCDSIRFAALSTVTDNTSTLTVEKDGLELTRDSNEQHRA